MGIGRRIKEARERLGLTQTELGESVGVTGSAITNYEKETSHPKEQVIYKLIETLGVDANYLFQDCVKLPKDKIDITLAEYEHIKKYRNLDDSGKNHIDYELSRETERMTQLQTKQDRIDTLEVEQQKISEKLRSIRMYTYFGGIACAGPGFYFDDIPTETIEAPDMGGDFIIGVNGDSMEPDYHDGDKLYVKKTEYMSPGDVGIFTIGNECFLKELGENGLISRNKEYDDIPGTEDVRLIGKVIGKVVED